MTIRPRLKAAAPDDLDSREDVWSNAPVVKSTANPAAKIGSNENNPPIPAWLSSGSHPVQPGAAANRNGRGKSAASASAASGETGRDWLYDWDAAAPEAPIAARKQRRRLFLSRNSTAPARGGRPIARRLIVSAACLAIVAAVGGGFLLLSRHGFEQAAPVVAQIKQEKAPAVARRGVAKPSGVKQEPRKAAAANTGVNEAQKAAALPARNKATVAKLPSPGSARWASNVVPPDRALANAHGGRPAPQSMAAFAPASVNAASATDMKPAQDNAKPAAEVKSASLTPEPKADDAETSSIPNDKNAAEKARSTLEDVVRSSAKKPIATGGGHAVVTTAVKLHASAENHSRVLTVVPAKASVELFSCDQWCKIAYDGHEGYIYKDFVKHSGHAPAAASRSEKPASKVASTGSDKLIGGAVVNDGSVKPTTAQQPAAAPKPAEPAATEPATMRHNPR